MQVDGVMGPPVMQVSVYADGWGYGSIRNAGVCMCRRMGLWV